MYLGARGFKVQQSEEFYFHNLLIIIYKCIRNTVVHKFCVYLIELNINFIG